MSSGWRCNQPSAIRRRGLHQLGLQCCAMLPAARSRGVGDLMRARQPLTCAHSNTRAPCSKPAIQDLVPIAFLRWNMTIYPESNTPLMSYPAGGWQFYRIVADFASGWTETHTCT